MQSDSEVGRYDLMLVFPACPQENDEILPDAGKDRHQPTPYSAAWYLQHCILDDVIFTLESRRAVILSQATMTSSNSPSSLDSEEVRESLRRMSSNPSMAFETVMENLDKEAEMEELEWQQQHQGGEEDESHELSREPDIKEAYLATKYAKTRGELQRRMLDLILRYALCKHCGLEVRAFHSVDRDELFVSLGACDEILRAHADLLGYKLQLSPAAACGLLGNRFKHHEFSPPYFKYDVDDEEIFATNSELLGKTPYKVFYDTYESGSIFHSSDRIRLISAIIEKAFDMQQLVALGFVNSYYPIHSQRALKSLTTSWAKISGCECKAEVLVDDICTYYGAKMAFRVSFLRFLFKQMLPLGLVVVPLLFHPSRLLVSMILGVLLMVWAATAEEFWKRRQFKKLLLWGMEDFAGSDSVRPQFYGEWGLSRADRLTLVKYYPWQRQVIRRCATGGCTFLFNTLVIATTTTLYGYHDKLNAAGHPRCAVAVNIAIALQIQIYNFFWSWAAGKLTDFDNYETKSQYRDALVLRTFSVYFVTSFCSLFYIAFVKHYLVGCTDRGCTEELATALRVLFLFNMVFHFLSMAIPYAIFRIGLWLERRAGMAKSTYKQMAESHMCYPEAQAKMIEYSVSEEVTDRMDVWVELGYVLFFGLAAPEVILLFLLSTAFRIHAFGWKLSCTMRRPFPDGSDGIGDMFMKIFNIMAHIAVASNIVLMLIQNAEMPAEQDLFFSLKSAVGTPNESLARDLDWKQMLAVFWILERSVALIRTIIDLVIPDIPQSVEVQRERREAVRQAMQRSTVSGLKKWEGIELKSAYEEHRKGKNCVLVLTRTHQWALVAPALVAASDCPVPSWTPEDPGFEHPWLTREKTGIFQEQQHEPLFKRTEVRAPRLVYAF